MALPLPLPEAAAVLAALLLLLVRAALRSPRERDGGGGVCGAVARGRPGPSLPRPVAAPAVRDGGGGAAQGLQREPGLCGERVVARREGGVFVCETAWRRGGNGAFRPRLVKYAGKSAAALFASERPKPPGSFEKSRTWAGNCAARQQYRPCGAPR